MDGEFRGLVGDLGLARVLNEDKVYKARANGPSPIAVSRLLFFPFSIFRFLFLFHPLSFKTK